MRKYTDEQKKEVATQLVASRTDAKPNGRPSVVAKALDIPVKTIHKWSREDAKFQAMIHEADLELYQACEVEVVEGKGSTLDKIRDLKSLAIDRLRSLIGFVPPDKLGTIILQLQQVEDRLEGSPQDSYIILADYGPEELRAALLREREKTELLEASINRSSH